MTGWEIEHLPTSATGKRMLKRVSPIYDNSIFMKMFYEGVGSEFDKVRAYFETLREQSFASTVDWAIEMQEHKYSIKPDKTLMLEERRERLKIKLSTKRPLNPAILEKYIAENFGVEVYLDESNPGFITIDLDHYEDLTKFLDWLLEEKPAHLMIKVVMHKNLLAPIYAGVGYFKFGRKRIPVGERVYWDNRQLVFDDGERKIVITPDNTLTAPLYHGIGYFKFGRKRIPTGDSIISMTDNEIVLDDSEQQIVIEPTQVTIDLDEDIRVIPVVEGFGGDFLTLRFDYPSSQKIITLANPRPDVTAADVNEVTDFAISNEIFVDKQGDNAQKLSQAKLVTITEEILF